MTGANSAVGLRSLPARYLFLDEVDAYPPLGRRGGRSGGPGRSPDPDLRPPAQDLPGLDPNHPGCLTDRARVSRQRPAPVLRPLPALWNDAVAALRAPALGQGPARYRGLLVRSLRAADRRTPQGPDAARGYLAGDRNGERSADGGLPPVGPLRPLGLAELGADRRPARAGAWSGRDPPCLRQRGPGRNTSTRSAKVRTGSGCTSGARTGSWVQCPREGSC